MFEDIDKAVGNLSNRNAEGVDRRDAADALGGAAARALAALRAHVEDPDVDVRAAVRGVLARMEAAPPARGTDAETRKEYSIDELARTCEKPGKRTVERNGDGYRVEVILKDDRRQTVYIMPFTRQDGIKLIRVYTFCGVARPNVARWALHTNMKLAQCAFALMKDEDQEQLVLLNSYLANDVTPNEIHLAVKEVAYYGDWVEREYAGLDDF